MRGSRVQTLLALIGWWMASSSSQRPWDAARSGPLAPCQGTAEVAGPHGSPPLHTAQPSADAQDDPAIGPAEDDDDGFGPSPAVSPGSPADSAAAAPLVVKTADQAAAGHGSYDRLLNAVLSQHKPFTPALPWELGSMRDLFPCPGRSRPWEPSGPAPPMAPALPAPPPEVGRPAACWSLAKRRVASSCWEAQQDASRHRALWKWRALIFEAFEHCRAGQQLYTACQSDQPDTSARLLLQDLFAGKANGTLQKRGGSLLQ